MLRLPGTPAGVHTFARLLDPAGLVRVAGLAAALLATTAARAAPTPAQLEGARRLFAQAEADEDGGRWSDALDKLRSVAEVKLTAGIRYHIALCEEHLGKLAQALTDYRASDAQAHTEKAKDVLRLVGKQLAALDHRVPRLTVHVVPDLPESTVSLDGEPVGRAFLGTAIAVDPGVHRVDAVAPDRPMATVMVTLQEHDSTVLELRLAEPGAPAGSPQAAGGAPAPGSAAGESPASPEGSRPAPTTGAPSAPPAVSAEGPGAPQGESATPPSATGRGANHTPAIVATALTAALAAGGVIFYVVAGNEHDRAVSQCAADPSPSPESCDPLRASVRGWDVAAAGAWIAAVAGGAVAVVLWSTAPTRSPAAAGLDLSIGPGAAVLRGRF